MRETLAPVHAEISVETALDPMPESIRRVLESRTLERAPTLRALLTYLWRSSRQPISEYAIATEALGRGPAFDARTDATVRVQISRLRQRLEKFYEQEGKDCPERIVIPLGSHQIKLESVVVANPVQVAEQQPRIITLQPRPAHRSLVLACASLGLLCLILSILLYRGVRISAANSPEPPPRFWKAFFGDGGQTRIILPTPVFFSYARGNASTVMVRDTSINEFADRNQSPVFGEMDGKLGLPQLAQNYTVTSDTFASVNLVRYLDRFGFATRLRSSAEAPVEALDTENVIAIGTWGTLTPLKSYLDSMSLRLGPHEQSIDIRNPGPGEPDRINAETESPVRGVWPGVVAVLPGRHGKTHLLILASRQTSALVSTLTSGNGLDQIERLWRSKGSPEYFEMAVNSEMNGMDLVRSWPVLLRPIAP